MKKRILLIDESLTVQKVVALTLDKSRYSVSYAKSRTEAMQFVADSPPNLILVSDQVTDVTIASFPKEVEAWLGKSHRPPPILLITGQDLKEMKHFAGVLKKPFSPQALQALVTQFTAGAEAPTGGAAPRESAPPAAAPRPAPAAPPQDEAALQARFNQTFNDEARLVRETFETEIEGEEATLLNIPAPGAVPAAPVQEVDALEGLNEDDGEISWAVDPPAAPTPPPSSRSAAPKAAAPPPPAAKPVPEVMRAEESLAYKGMLEHQVESTLQKGDLTEVVQKVLERMLPPIVERLVQERLDQLLKDQEAFVELES